MAFTFLHFITFNFSLCTSILLTIATVLATESVRSYSEGIWEQKNREGIFPIAFAKTDIRRHSVSIVDAQNVLLGGLQQYLALPDADLGLCLRKMVERPKNEPYVDEYGHEIRHYKKIFRFIWKQYNETLVQNYAISQFNKDKLDMCSLARFLSHQPIVKGRETIVKRMGKALNYTCHPCTPYKRKEHDETFVPDIEEICPNGFNPEESLLLCEGFDLTDFSNQHYIPPSSNSLHNSSFDNNPVRSENSLLPTNNASFEETSCRTAILSGKFLENVKNRDCQLPPVSPLSSLEFRNHSTNIINAHKIIRKALQQYLDVEEADLGTYLRQLRNRLENYVDEYGQVIRSYKKVFGFIWEQYNETVVHNYASKQLDKDKIDLCSVARFLSHQTSVDDRKTIMKQVGDALAYKCHPCTPYRRKKYGETIIPNTNDISPDGVSPEASLILCKGNQSDEIQITSSLNNITTLLVKNEKKDQACIARGGTCKDWRINICTAGYYRGLCSGDIHNRCCLSCNSECRRNEATWSASDSVCKSFGGTCMAITNYCKSTYQRGKCGGPSNRRCCPL